MGITNRDQKAKLMANDNAPKESSEEKKLTPLKPSPSEEKAIIPYPTEEDKGSGGSIDRDAVLARVEREKKHALVKAWEDGQKARADNKASKNVASIESWENSRRAQVQAQLKEKEQKFQKKKAKYAEKMKNKMAEIQKVAAEKKAIIEARKGKDVLKVEETAAKYRATGNVPKKLLGCFSSS